jgi:hypothetical protein
MSGSRFTPGAAASERTRRLRKIWRAMTADERALAIQSGGPDRGKALIQALRGHLASALKVRPGTVQSWGVAQIADSTLRAPLGEEVLADLLIAFHLKERVGLLSAFLDTAGIPHTDGATEPGYTVQLDEAAVLAAADTLLANFPEHDCRIYFATLVALEGGAWAPLEQRLDESFLP